MRPISNLKKPTLFFVFSFLHLIIIGQNVGIGVSNPSKELSVKGTIIVDNDNENLGLFGQAGLRFGEFGNIWITSNKNPAVENFNGIDLWTNSKRRISITSSGNVGIGLANPLFNLHVDGSTKVADNIFTGGSAAIEGSAIVGSGVWSNSHKFVVTGGSSLFNDDVTVNGIGKVLNTLIVGVGLPTSEKFYVTGTSRFNGNVHIESNLYSNGNTYAAGNTTIDGNAIVEGNTRSARIAIGGIIDNNYRLRVYDGNARIGGDFHASGKGAIGGEVDNNFKFRVYNGNSRFGGDVEVTGNINTGSIETGTINGKGVVKSNGNSSLRVGFDQVSINTSLPPGGVNDVVANISEFSGNNNDVRVSISQFVSDPGGIYSNWSSLNFNVLSVNSDDDTCVIRVVNTRNFDIQIKGTLYLMSVVKD